MEYIDRKNPYPRGFRVPEFTLFSRGDEIQSIVEHIGRFTVQCGELANFENFDNFKLRLFPNSLTGPAFTWFSTLPRNSIGSWREMERAFHTQFFRAEPEVCIAELSRLTQRPGESSDAFLARFKKMRNRCKIVLPETEYVKMAQRCVEIELHKKFQEIVKSESLVVCPSLTKLKDRLKKSTNNGMQYTFDTTKTEEIFDFLLAEKFLSLPSGHKMPTKEELKDKEYCMYHDLWSHPTVSCWGL
ncbi:uncharacterized protein LOC120010240 [Tripterygium wilfordii]|uniref:uncharacterized protein LOC120010240 n=1 Tax=Tripterygium wilfordii TaxID=458696 RepID=UPI0018F82E83|nr:uncharacterized protein LOC120010240 [Tripterygium wilfordii]